MNTELLNLSNSASHTEEEDRPGTNSGARILFAMILTISATFGAMAFASPAHASPESAPHSGPFNGIDLNVERDDVGGIIVRSYSTGDQYCIEIRPGWNEIPTESALGAEITATYRCGVNYTVANAFAQVKGGEHWVLNSNGIVRDGQNSERWAYGNAREPQ